MRFSASKWSVEPSGECVNWYRACESWFWSALTSDCSEACTFFAESSASSVLNVRYASANACAPFCASRGSGEEYEISSTCEFVGTETETCLSIAKPVIGSPAFFAAMSATVWDSTSSFSVSRLRNVGDVPDSRVWLVTIGFTQTFAVEV